MINPQEPIFSNKFNNQLFESLTSGCAVYQPCEDFSDFIFIAFNKAAEEMENINRDQVLGKKVTNVFPGITDMGLLDVFRHVAKTGEETSHPIVVYSDDRTPLVWRENKVFRNYDGNIVAVYQDQTKLALQQHKLEMSEKKLRQLYLSSRDILLECDVEAKILSANPTMEKLFGLSYSELHNQPLNNFIAPHHQSIIDSLCDGSILNDNQPEFSTELDILTSNQQKLAVKAHFTITHDAKNDISGFQGILQDVTKSKKQLEKFQNEQFLNNKLQEILTQKKEISEIIQEAINNISEVLKVDTISINFLENEDRGTQSLYLRTGESSFFCKECSITKNRTALALCPINQYINQTIGKTLANDTPNKFFHSNNLSQLLSEKNSPSFLQTQICNWQQYESMLIIPLVNNQEYVGFLILGSQQPNFFENDEITIIEHAAINLSMTYFHHQTQRQLRENENRLQLALAGSSDGLWDWNLVTDEIFFSPRWKEMLGYEVHEIEDSVDSWKSLVHPEDEKRALAAITDYLADKTPHYEVEFQMLHKKGYYVPILARGKGIRNEEGVYERFTGTHIDMTQIKAVELQLKETMVELERKKEEAERFAYVASHDLQEPLRMIASYTQLLELRYMKELDEKAQKYIKYIIDGAQRMQQLIDDLLSFSRLSTTELKISSVDLDFILTRVLENLAVSISENNVKIQHDPLPIVLGNKTQLLQLFQNLLSNAIKFRGQTTPEITIKATINERLEISITDNGIGIEERYLEKIFVIFQRLHSRDEYAGTGIGLALCKKIVEQHGGVLSVTSTVGIGTTFTFSLSLDKETPIHE